MKGIKRIKALLWTLTVIRWLWFAGVEKVPSAMEAVAQFWNKTVNSPFGDWAASFQLLEKVPFITNLAGWLWSSAMWQIPACLIGLHLLMKYLPALRLAVGKCANGLSRLYPRLTAVEHVILRIISPDRRTEETVDIIEEKRKNVSDICSVVAENGVFIKYDENGSVPMEIGKWYTSSDSYNLKLVTVKV